MIKKKQGAKWSDNKSGRELLVKILAKAVHKSITEEKKFKNFNFLKGTRLSATEDFGV